MPQQINLFQPVLLAPRRHFPARAMAQALGLWLVALLALAGWASWRTQALEAELATARAAHAGESASLQQALAARGGAADPAALVQEIAALDARLSARRQWLGGDDSGRTPSGLLIRVAQTVPPPVWLQELRWRPDQIELAGHTLRPEALQPWLAALGPAARALKVERRSSSDGAAAPVDGTVWAFRASRGLDGGAGDSR